MKPLDVISHIEEALLRTAEWREAKAQQFPEDTRNITAAELLRQLAADTVNIPDGMALSYAETAEDYEAETAKDGPDVFEFDRFAHGATLSQIEGDALRDVGFRSTPDTAAEFVEGMLRELTIPLARRFPLVEEV